MIDHHQRTTCGLVTALHAWSLRSVSSVVCPLMLVPRLSLHKDSFDTLSDARMPRVENRLAGRRVPGGRRGRDGFGLAWGGASQRRFHFGLPPKHIAPQDAGMFWRIARLPRTQPASAGFGATLRTFLRPKSAFEGSFGIWHRRNALHKVLYLNCTSANETATRFDRCREPPSRHFRTPGNRRQCPTCYQK